MVWRQWNIRHNDQMVYAILCDDGISNPAINADDTHINCLFISYFFIHQKKRL